MTGVSCIPVIWRIAILRFMLLLIAAKSTNPDFSSGTCIIIGYFSLTLSYMAGWSVLHELQHKIFHQDHSYPHSPTSNSADNSAQLHHQNNPIQKIIYPHQGYSISFGSILRSMAPMVDCFANSPHRRSSRRLKPIFVE